MKPGNKYYPKNIEKWENFAGEQHRVFSTARSIFHPKDKLALRLFSPILSVEDQGRLHCNIRIANEASLRTYEKSALEVQVADIINRLSEIMQDPKEFQLGQGIIFENDPNSLSEIAEEVQERLTIQPPRTPLPNAPPSSSSSTSSLEPDSNSKPGRTRADQYCIYKQVDDKRQLLFLVESKPPHKLSIGNLSRFQPMNVKKDVLDRVDIPSPIPPNMIEEDAKQSKEIFEDRLQYNADRVTVAVATQTFHYMIENGLEYSYITTGEAFVFLRIDWDDEKNNTTLFYHVAMPADEVDADNVDNDIFDFQRTAIGQVLGLCLLASESKQRTHAERKDAKKQLEKHPVTSLETLNEQTPASERQLGAKKKRVPKSPLYKGGRKGTLISDYNLRSKCKPGGLPKNSDNEQDDDDGPNTPIRPSASSSKKSQGKLSGQRNYESRKNSNQTSSSRGTQRQYCTQRCLMGIAREWPLDKNCPNASLHARHGQKHAVDQSKFLNLVQKQLAEDLDHNCEPLGLQGARGALFQITLTSHGYVFVGKGTVQAFVPDLRHEGDMYLRLAKLQGAVVPVYLGNIDLTEWYYLDVGVRILHMLLMSWGGNLADEDESMKDSSELQKEIKRTVTDVRRAGVDQMDVRPSNLLWNRETHRVMLIDFERAAMTQCGLQGNGIRGERVMQEISPNRERKPTGSPKRKTRRRVSSV